jgi:hypothetical protein
MNRVDTLLYEEIMRRLTTCAWLIFIPIVCGLCLFFSPPTTAYGAGGVELLEYSGVEDGQQDVDPKPPLAWKFSLHFSKNVSFPRDGADPAFIANNLSLVRLEKSDGSLVGAYRVRAGFSMEERGLIYIDLDDWLEPLTTYRIVVEPGIRAANGEDVSTERYTIEFKTGPQLSFGMTVFEVVALVCVGLFVVAGATVQIVRVVRRRRGTYPR